MTKTPTRLATLCVHGAPVPSTKDNLSRFNLLAATIEALREHPECHPIEALVLPGGFFRLSRALGTSTFAQRQTIVAKDPITGPIRRALEQLEDLSPRLLLITGVLATPRDVSERIEQVGLAFDRDGLRGAARKIFPTKQESDRRRFVSPFVGDYADPGRLVQLPSGQTTLLHACYDLFGTADLGNNSSQRRNAIRRLLSSRGKVAFGTDQFRALRDQGWASYRELVATAAPTVAVSPLHGFQGVGRDGYWQRHGIARASATLGGALVVAAAHFSSGLPGPDRSTLAASGVPRSHLSAGPSRKAHRLRPVASLTIEAPGGLRALLRIFEPRSKRPSSSAGSDR
jgi:hypothetical protein